MIIEEPYILGNDLKTKEVLRQTIEMYKSKGACPYKCMTCHHVIVDVCRVFSHVILSVEKKEQIRYEIIKGLCNKISDEELFERVL